MQPGRFNQSDVAEYLGTTNATVSRQLDIGAKAGYLTVAVSPTSRRENTVTLTPAGEEAVAKGDAIVLDESQRLFGHVPPFDCPHDLERALLDCQPPMTSTPARRPRPLDRPQEVEPLLNPGPFNRPDE